MSRVIQRIDNTLGLVLAGEADLGGGKVVEIFGEIHNMIPEAPNFFTDVVKSNVLNEDDIVVLNEHATVLCHVKEHERHLVHQVRGSDFIFFRMMMDHMKNGRKKKKPICIDNRIESGLLSAIEEKNFMNFLLESRESGVYSLPEMAMILTQCFKCLENASELQAEFEGIYEEEFQKNISAIERQLTIAALSLAQGKDFFKAVGTLIPDIQNGMIICTCLYLAVKNIKTIGSLLVDVNILKTAVAQPAGKRIVVFTGFAHAFRLLSVLQNAEITFEAANIKDLQTSVSVLPEETVSKEEDMLEILKKLQRK